VAIQIQGFSGVVAEVSGPNYRTLRVTLRPVEYGTLGQYRVIMWSFNSIAAGLAAGSDIAQIRWTLTPQLALIWGIDLDGFLADTAGFTPGFGNFSLFFARSWTVDGSGGIAVNFTGNNQKLRTSMASASITMRNADGSSALTTGTRTLDAQPLGRLPFSVAAGANTQYLKQLGLYGPASHEAGGNPAPVVLSQNEGLVVTATVPATGVWSYVLTTAWSEVSAY
jgi:hypothetical protein